MRSLMRIDQPRRSKAWHNRSSPENGWLAECTSENGRRDSVLACAIRAVHSEDGMTADWFPLPTKSQKKVSSHSVNEIRGISRVVYDITSKAPRTIEWK